MRRLQRRTLGDIAVPATRCQRRSQEQAHWHGGFVDVEEVAVHLPPKGGLQFAPPVGLEEVRIGHRRQGAVPGGCFCGSAQAGPGVGVERRWRLSLMARISIAGVGHRDTSLGPCSKVRAALSMAHGHRRLCGDAPTIVDSRVRVTPIWVTTATLAPSPAAAAARLKVASTLSWKAGPLM